MPAPLSTQLQYTAQSFGDISRFLREGVADEESRQLRDSLAALSQHVESAVRARRLRSAPTDILHCVEQLARCVREHQLFLTGLGSAWHAMYELGVYQQAVRELRDAIGAWHAALERRSASEAARFDAFELLAWRTLGEALLVIDMYEHGTSAQSEFARPMAAAAPRRPPLLGRLRRWLIGR